MQQERFLVCAFKRVNELLVIACAQRGYDQCLGFTTGEQGCTVCTRQQTNFRDNRTYGIKVAAINAFAGVQNGIRTTLFSSFLKALPTI